MYGVYIPKRAYGCGTGAPRRKKKDAVPRGSGVFSGGPGAYCGAAAFTAFTAAVCSACMQPSTMRWPIF